MKVEITNPPGLFAEGDLKGVVSEQDTSSPHIVIELRVEKIAEPVLVTLTDHDLLTIVRLARGSKVKRIRDAVG
jgi:hypothetical protein